MKHIDVPVETFKNIYDEKTHIVIDVRTPEEFQTGHIKDAQNLNLYDNFEEVIDELDKDKRYLVYCGAGGRSRQAMHLMRDLGFEEVINLDGGIRSWNENGFEIEK